MRAQGGRWTADELAGYRVQEREPLRFGYRGWEIVTAPPPSSGGIVTGIALNWTSASLSPDGTSLAVGMNGGVEYTYGSGLRRLDLTPQSSADRMLNPSK